jgi:hypothetical protein
MYGLQPEDKERLQPLVGATLFQLAIGQYQLQFNFEARSPRAISVESKCEVLDAAGTILGVWERGQFDSFSTFHDLLGLMIASVKVESNKSAVATFENGHRLRLLDDSDQYESFKVGDLIV